MSKLHQTASGQTELSAQNAETQKSGKTLHTSQGSPADEMRDAPLPRSKRRPRRAKQDRGLAADEELAQLATAYLERQRIHWPELVEAGLLPEPSPSVIREMVEDFKSRHRGVTLDIDDVRSHLKRDSQIGGVYARFSTDNSNPMSALDQMVNCLDKASAEHRFVPWQYIFADYSVTGLDAARQGYSSYKAILSDKSHFIETTYIDDFTRASRDELEWWRLAALSKRLNKRMVGASDGFDVSSPDWDVRVTIYGLLSRLFIKQLREKVRRGQRGAARRGTCLGKPSLGFTRRVHRDKDGNVVARPDGRPRHEICADPETRRYRVLLYELFAEKNWSAYKIARHFNKIKVDDSDRWTERAINNLLRSPTSIGVFIWNRTRREFDWDVEKWVVVKNRRADWEVHFDCKLALIPMDLWRAAQRKLSAIRRTDGMGGRKTSRNQIRATTLFSGTLVCAYCGKELRLVRSKPGNRQLGCWNGPRGVSGCELTTSKSTKLIEECLLGYIRDVILTETTFAKLIVKANALLEDEAKKPLIDTASMKRNARTLDAKIMKLVKRVEDEPDEELCSVYEKRIKALQKDLKALRRQIREADQQNLAKDVKPIEMEWALTQLADLRELLNAETSVAAQAIRRLTGPITIRQEPYPNARRGARWIASFSPDLLRLVLQLARDKDRREFVMPADGERTDAATVEVVIEKVPKYEQFASAFKRLRDNGASIRSIAHSFGVSWPYTKEILHFAETGERPRIKSGKSTGNGRRRCVYREIAPEVVRLRDQKVPFRRIAAKLGVSESTVLRAYDHLRPDEVRESTDNGERTRRGRYLLLDEDKRREINRLLRSGATTTEIVRQVGCGRNTVCRARQRLKSQKESDRST